jgi:hypothetical protein
VVICPVGHRAAPVVFFQIIRAALQLDLQTALEKSGETELQIENWQNIKKPS